jgi:hypothetical protein
MATDDNRQATEAAEFRKKLDAIVSDVKKKVRHPHRGGPRRGGIDRASIAYAAPGPRQWCCSVGQ